MLRHTDDHTCTQSTLQREKDGLILSLSASTINRWLFAAMSLLACVLIYTTAQQWQNGVLAHEHRFKPIEGEEHLAGHHQGRIWRDNDSLYWIRYARDMVSTGQWRIRHTYADNAPFGRPVHWSQSIAWQLVVQGWVRAQLTGESLRVAIENAAVWTGPLQHALFVVGFGWLIWKRLGLLPALIWMSSLVTMRALDWCFNAMRPDHHGWHLIASIGSLLTLILGGLGWTETQTKPSGATGSIWLRPLHPPPWPEARWHFVLSGILGGIGLWTGATMQLAGIALFTASAMLLMVMMPQRFHEAIAGTVYRPVLWRIWGYTGAGVAILFYLIEYAPHFPGMRLEINHPLYAVSWICATEAVARLATWQMASQRRWWQLSIPFLWVLGALSLPAMLALGPAEWHSIRDPVMMRLHDTIMEFFAFQSNYGNQPGQAYLRYFGILPIFFLLVPLVGRNLTTGVYEWTALSLAMISAIAYMVLAHHQIRWLDLATTSSLLLAVVSLDVIRRHAGQTRIGKWGFAGLMILLLMQPVVWGTLRQGVLNSMRDPAVHNQLLARSIFQRQAAVRMQEARDEATWHILTDPDMGANLQYYGDIPVVTTLYWENMEGLHDAAAFFAATNFDHARDIAQRRGLTHVVLPASTAIAIVQAFHYKHTGDETGRGAEWTVGGMMLRFPDQLPEWIERDAELEQLLTPRYMYQNNQTIEEPLLVYTMQWEPEHDGAE